MKKQILELRAKGKNYNEIVAIVGCSKSTVSYHCGEGQKEKSLKRSRSNRKTEKEKIVSKIRVYTSGNLREFKRGKPTLLTNSTIVYQEAFDKIVKNPFCYLTGRKINFEDTKSYNLDHIIPWSKGGSNDLNNMGLTCKDANMSKTDLSVEEYLALCKEVLEHNGYKVNKK